MSDAQYKVNRKDYSLVSDFVSYRNTTPQVKKIITAEDQQIKIIADRLTTWYLGSGQQSSDKWIKMREDNEEVFIRTGLKAAQNSEQHAGHAPLLRKESGSHGHIAVGLVGA